MDDCPRPQKLLCTWHVDKAISTELRKKIGDLPTEVEIYKMFQTVLEQTNKSLFDDCMQGFLNHLSLSFKPMGVLFHSGTWNKHEHVCGSLPQGF